MDPTRLEATRLEYAMKAPWSIFPRKRLDISFTDIAYGMQQCLVPDTAARRASVLRGIAQAWGEQAWSDEEEGYGEDFDSDSDLDDEDEKDGGPSVSQSLRTTSSSASATAASASAVANARGASKFVMVALSVRSSLDALLTVLGLPAGTEVVMSAVCIKDMSKIVQLHGCVPVPVDLLSGELQVKEDVLRSACSAQTGLIVCSHIWGAIPDMSGVIAIARENGCLVFEDCAECFTGPRGYRGHPESDVTSFSFGTIKTATALGGAVNLFRDAGLRDRVRASYARLPFRATREYSKRLIKYGGAHSIMRPDIWGALVRTWRGALGRAHFDETVTYLSRGFPGPDLVDMLRHQPSTALLAVMLRRFTNFDPEKLERRIERCELLRRLIDAEALPGVTLPGAQAKYHSYWLFPVCFDGDKSSLCERMLTAGFDATATATQLGTIDQWILEQPDAARGLVPSEMKEVMGKVVYLPVTSEMPMWGVEKLARVFAEAVREANSGIGGVDFGDDDDDEEWDDEDDEDEDGEWDNEDDEDDDWDDDDDDQLSSRL